MMLFALMGAAWRRWFGSEGPRSIKLAFAFLIGLGALTSAGVDLWASGCAALLLAAAWTPGHTFDPWYPLIWRYGVPTLVLGLGLAYLGYPGGLYYAPVGLFAPVGYVAARKSGASCWTCWGEAWLGGTIYGGLAALAL